MVFSSTLQCIVIIESTVVHKKCRYNFTRYISKRLKIKEREILILILNLKKCVLRLPIKIVVLINLIGTFIEIYVLLILSSNVE